MNTSAVQIKVDAKVKERAQKVAEELGLSLSAVVNNLLKQFVRSKRVFLPFEKPSAYLKKGLREAEDDVKNGYVSPPFTNAKDAVGWLNDPNARYENGKIK